MTASKLFTAALLASAGMALGYAALNGPAVAVAADAAPSQRVDNFRLTSHDLESYELYRMADAKAVVILTHGAGDPAVKAAAAGLKSLQAAYSNKGVEFLMLNSNPADTREAVAADAKAAGYDLPILIDSTQLVGEQLGASRNAEVFVINPKTWQVAYRGPLTGKTSAADALEALLAGRSLAPVSANGAGRPIAFPERGKAALHAKISYAETIAPLIKEKCAECHQPGGIAPMALNNYSQIKGFAPMIRETVRTQRMPPFHADTAIAAIHGAKNLSGDQIKTLVHWIEAGAPRGAGADPLAAIKFQAPEWPLGKPDLVLSIPAYDIPASGVVDYQRPFAVNPLTEGKWVRASTIKVDQRQAVHHILTGYMTQAPGPGVQAAESRWGASMGTYAVGAESTVQRDDIGVFLPAGGAVGFQNHYTPFGKAVTDKSQIGLYFYDKQPKMIMRTRVIADPTISIAPNTERHKERAYMTFDKEAMLYGVFIHAHYRGNGSQLSIQYPDGRQKLLISVPKYDFNWQRDYEFAQPVLVPAGSKLIATYTYDNSKRNPANPDSNRVVPWGAQSWDEMLYTQLRFRWTAETSANAAADERNTGRMDALGLLDDNIDGKVQLSELKGSIGAPLKASFPTLDANKDGALDAKELASVQNALQRSLQEDH
jgi:mono/diheme cytochrome c family protein